VKIVAKKSALLQAAMAAAEVADDRGTMPAYKSIVLTAGELSLARASSGEQQVELLIQGAITERVGTAMISAKHFADRVKSFDDGDVAVDSDGTQVFLRQGKRTHRLLAFAGYELPSHIKHPGNSGTIAAVKLLDRLSLLAPVMCTDMSRPTISGIRIVSTGGNSRLVAADSSAMARSEFDSDIRINTLIPPKAVHQIISFLHKEKGDVRVSADVTRFFLDKGTASYSTKFVGDPHTDMNKFFPPRSGPILRFDRDECANALKFIAACKPHLDRVRFVPVDDGFFLRAADIDGYTSEEFVSSSRSDIKSFSASLRRINEAMVFCGSGSIELFMQPGDRNPGMCPGICLFTSGNNSDEFVVSPYLYDIEDVRSTN